MPCSRAATSPEHLERRSGLQTRLRVVPALTVVAAEVTGTAPVLGSIDTHGVAQVVRFAFGSFPLAALTAAFCTCGSIVVVILRPSVRISSSVTTPSLVSSSTTCRLIRPLGPGVTSPLLLGAVLTLGTSARPGRTATSRRW